MNASSGNESIDDSQFVLPASRRAVLGGGGIDVALITGMVVLPPIVALGLELRSPRAGGVRRVMHGRRICRTTPSRFRA